MLDGSSSEDSTKKEEVEKEKPRASHSTFLPCSFLVIFLISAPTLLGFWFASGISPGGAPRRQIFGWQYNYPKDPVPLAQGPLRAETTWDVENTDEILIWYITSARKVDEKCKEERCCVYQADSKSHLLKNNAYNQVAAWTNAKDPTVQICENEAERVSKQFHLKIKRDSNEIYDIKLQLGKGIPGLTYGSTFWVIPSKDKQKEYLLCDLPPSTWLDFPKCPNV